VSSRIWMAVVAVVLLVGVVYYLSRPPRPSTGPGQAVPQPTMAALDCNEGELIASVKLVVANPAIRDNAQLQPSWEQVMSCLRTMQVDLALGDTNHTLLPAESHSTVTGIGYAVASIYPRHNVWWDNAPDPAGKVTARIESNRRYVRLGLNATSQNYVIVAGLPSSTPQMIVVNADGATAIGNQEGGAKYIPHGPIVGAQQRPLIDPEPPPARAAGPTDGGLSPAALQCFLSGMKACFIDSPTQRIEPLQGGFAFGFGRGILLSSVNPGTTVPWVACAKYGCCCGGTQCHTD
jgi:hypothetical protein